MDKDINIYNLSLKKQAPRSKVNTLVYPLEIIKTNGVKYALSSQQKINNMNRRQLKEKYEKDIAAYYTIHDKSVVGKKGHGRPTASRKNESEDEEEEEEEDEDDEEKEENEE